MGLSRRALSLLVTIAIEVAVSGTVLRTLHGRPMLLEGDQPPLQLCGQPGAPVRPPARLLPLATRRLRCSQTTPELYILCIRLLQAGPAALAHGAPPTSRPVPRGELHAARHPKCGLRFPPRAVLYSNPNVTSAACLPACLPTGTSAQGR